jgi:hypothetical protein
MLDIISFRHESVIDADLALHCMRRRFSGLAAHEMLTGSERHFTT